MVQTRTSDWIGANCRSAESFQPLARRAMASHIGDVFYIDLANGSDGNDGENWQKAFKTFNYAVDQGTAYNNDYFLVKGWKTETGTGIIGTLDIGYQHFLGAAGVMNPVFPEKGSLYQSGESNDPYIAITAEFVEFGGFSIMSHGGDTNASLSSRIKGSLQLGTYATDGGNKAYIHNVHLPDWNHAETTAGLTVTGTHYFVIDGLVVDSIYGNIDEGIYISGGLGTNPANAVIKNCWFKGGAGGALATGIKLESDAGDLQSSYIEGIRHTRGTTMFNLGGSGNGYCQVEDVVGDMVLKSMFDGTSDHDGRDEIWTNYKWSVGSKAQFRDGIFVDTAT